MTPLRSRVLSRVLSVYIQKCRRQSYNTKCGPPGRDPGHLPRLTLYTKTQCSLCDEALEVIEPLRHRYRLEKVDITLPGNEYWLEMYRLDIPVFHLDGEYLMKHKADLPLLKTNLDNLEDEPRR